MQSCGNDKLHTSFPEARQERRLHNTPIERLSNAVIIPEGLVVHVHQCALQFPDLNAAEEQISLWHSSKIDLKETNSLQQFST